MGYVKELPSASRISLETIAIEAKVS